MKYQTLIVQMWDLCPRFCSYNCPNMRDSLIEVVKYIEPILNKDVLGMR